MSLEIGWFICGRHDADTNVQCGVAKSRPNWSKHSSFCMCNKYNTSHWSPHTGVHCSLYILLASKHLYTVYSPVCCCCHSHTLIHKCYAARKQTKTTGSSSKPTSAASSPSAAYPLPLIYLADRNSRNMHDTHTLSYSARMENIIGIGRLCSNTSTTHKI